MKCPACATTDLLMAERSGIEIDYCPQCRGVWLDRGELDKIIERSMQAGTAGPVMREAHPIDNRTHPGDADHRYGRADHGDCGQHRRKSFWHELFD